MRHFALLAALLSLPALSATADTVLATSHITAVTIYPQGAQITREVTFAAPPGPHEVLITDLPSDIVPEMIRLASADATLGAFALRSDRLPPRNAAPSAALDSAKAEVTKAEVDLATAKQAVDAIAAEVEAQQAQIGFLTGLKLDAAGATADSLSTIAAMIQSRVLAARQAAQQAQLGLPAANATVKTAQDALDRAVAARDALTPDSADYTALSVSVTTSGDTGHLTVTHFMQDASWAPVYDITLDRKAPSLTMERGVLVSQSTGEDWSGIDLTLSTAQPSAQSEPSQLSPDLKSIGEPAPPADDTSMAAPSVMAAPSMTASGAESRSLSAEVAYQGDTVVYHYPAAVDVATGVENLRLTLDQLAFVPQVQARAVPRYDLTAFLMAKLTNTSPEILLPGTAYLTRDGALVGASALPALAPGAETTLAFGAIEGLKLSRDMPQKAEGDHGIFTTSTEIEEKAVLKVENLTNEAWPVHLLDQVPYSEQDDLKITFTADPAVTAQDVDGDRGILAWDFEIAPKATQEVTLDSLISWPQGKALQ